MRRFPFKTIVCGAALSVVLPTLAAQTPTQAPTASQPAPNAKPAPITNVDQVTVTAYRAPLGVLESPVTTRLLTQQSLRSTAGLTFDDQVRCTSGAPVSVVQGRRLTGSRARTFVFGSLWHGTVDQGHARPFLSVRGMD